MGIQQEELDVSSPHLSRGLNSLIADAAMPGACLRLRDLRVSQVLEIVFGQRPERSTLSVCVVRPVGQGTGPEDNLLGVIVAYSLHDDFREMLSKSMVSLTLTMKGCAVDCACTFTPDAYMNMSLIQPHTISIGRHLSFYVENEEGDAPHFVSPQVVSGWTILGG